MRFPVRPLLALLVFAAPSAQAAQLELGWDTRMGWDSNPLRSENDEDPDFNVYAGPNVALRDQGRSLDWFLNYRLRYEQYFDLNSVNGFEHFGNGELSWRLSPRSELRFTQYANRTRGLGIDFLEPVPGIDPVDAIAEGQIQRSLTIRSTSTATFTHRLTPLWTFESNADATVYEYDEEARSDVLSFRGSGQFTRPLGRRLVAGVGSAVTRQDFDDSSRTVGTGTTIYEGFGVLRYQFEPTLALSLSGGPAWSQPDDAADTSYQRTNAVGQDQERVARLIDPTRCVLPLPGTPAGTVRRNACPTRSGFYDLDGTGPNDPVFLQSALITTPDARIDTGALEFTEVDVLGDFEDPEGSITYFGRAALNKNWRNFEGELSYQRRASTSSGLGSTNLDIANARLSWLPDRRRWRVDLRGTWTLQSSATEQASFDQLLDPTPTTVWVDDQGRVYDTFVPGALEIPNAARVIGSQQVGFVDSGVEIETWRLDLRGVRRFSSHLTATASTGWWRQDISGDFQEPRTVDNFRVQVGVTLSLAPIEF